MVVGLFPLAAWGGGLALPEGPVVLEVAGSLGRANVGAEAHFDIGMLDGLPQEVLRTSSLWTDRVSEFRGPRLLDLLAALGVEQGRLTLIALNDYRIEIPFSDLKRYPVVLATRQDEKRLKVRNKGPLWVVYPWDDFPELKSETYFSRSIWQLRRIVVN
jgi:hypothetical protein